MASLAIVGPGAVGSVLAAILHETGRHELVLCARRPLAALHVQTTTGTVRWNPRCITSPAEAGPVDWVLVATKAYDSAGAAQWLPKLVTGQTRVAIVQNGIEHVARFQPYLPPSQLVPVMIDCPAERTAERTVQRGVAKLVVASGPAGESFCRLFDHPAAAASCTDDLASALWQKLCLNAAGVVSALVDQPAGVMRREDAAFVGRQIVSEVVAVARAEGVNLPADLPDRILDACRKAPADGVNSLLADCRAGRPTEVDARNGVVVRLGRKHGIPTPYNEMATRLITLRTTTG